MSLTWGLLNARFGVTGSEAFISMLRIRRYAPQLKTADSTLRLPQVCV